jgi:hypothetical protein
MNLIGILIEKEAFFEMPELSESKGGTRDLSPCPIVMGQGIVVN